MVTPKVVQLSATARESSTPKNALMISQFANDTNIMMGVNLPSWDMLKTEDGGHISPTPELRSVLAPLSVTKREASAPKNALMISQFGTDEGHMMLSQINLDPNLTSPGLVQNVGDERGNTKSNQKMRGGIGG